MNNVAAIVGPLNATQSLAAGARAGFDGLAFLVAAELMIAATLIIALGTPHLPPVIDEGTPP